MHEHVNEHGIECRVVNNSICNWNWNWMHSWSIWECSWFICWHVVDLARVYPVGVFFTQVCINLYEFVQILNEFLQIFRKKHPTPHGINCSPFERLSNEPNMFLTVVDSQIILFLLFLTFAKDFATVRSAASTNVEIACRQVRAKIGYMLIFPP